MSEPIGEVRVDVRADTSKVDPDVEKGLKKAAKNADDDLEDIGEEWGETLSRSMGKRLEKEGPELARSIQRGVDKETVVSKVTVEYDRDNNVTRRWVTKVATDLERAVQDSTSGGGGGPFGKVGMAVSDAIGAGFNISGRSPLIVALVPLIGAIVELVIGAVQAVNALAAALFVIPGLIAAIVFQAGTLFIAFQGVGTAIEGAFKAKNAEELKLALQGLMPAAQEFVKSLLPLKDLFANIRAVVQEGFFVTFGNSVTAVAKTLGPVLQQQLGPLAAALGEVGRTLVTFFADPSFRYFVALIIPATINWLKEFGPALYKFLFGLTQIGIYLTPFFEWVGGSLTSSLASLGDWLNRLSSDPEFLDWLERMKVTFGQLGKVIDSAAAFVFSLARAIDRAGGDKVLEDIANQLGAFAAYLSTDLGTKAIEGLIHVVEVLSFFFTFLVLDVLAVLTAFELVLESLRHGVWPWLVKVFTSIPEFFTNLWNVIVDFFTQATDRSTQWGINFMASILSVRDTIVGYFIGLRDSIINRITEWGNSVGEFFSGLPGRIQNAVGDLGNTLYNAGKNLIQGLINGILSMTSPFVGAIQWVLSRGKDNLPHSPAKEGPLSGRGDPLYAGQEIVNRLATGMEMEQPRLNSAVSNTASTIVFGPNSVQATFNGQLPSNSQAMALGGALGGGIANQLAVRDTRLAVRAMA